MQEAAYRANTQGRMDAAYRANTQGGMDIEGEVVKRRD